VCFSVSDDFAKSILAFLPSPKCDLVEAEKAMFKVTSYPLYLILYFLTNRKLDLREAEKGNSRVRLALFSHILPTKQPKIRLRRGLESNESGGPQTLQSIFLAPWNI
jgi:hypothetical protein